MGYYSSANCTVTFKTDESEISCDELYALQVTSSEGIMPYHSWASREADHFIDGQVVVHGSLILNVNSSGYLRRLIDGNGTAFTNYKDKGVKDRQKLDTIFRELNTAVTILNSRPEEGILDRVHLASIRKQAIKARQNNNNPTYKNTTRHLPSTEVELQVHNNVNKQIVDIVYGVRFTGKSMEVAAGSSQNIKYAFPFVAKALSI